MDSGYSVAVYRKLKDEFERAALHRPMRVERYEQGDELAYDVTGVAGANRGSIRLVIEDFVGGGFAGQVYRVKVLDLRTSSGPIGGLAVGEPKTAMFEVLDNLAVSLPTDLPRYLMGVGFPVDLLRAISHGMDLFDCVAPTRIGRNGSAYTPDGPLQIRNARFRRDTSPLDESCDCETCRTYSRGYLRHLFAADELLGLRALSLHNVRFLTRLASAAREQIEAGRFEGWSGNWINRYNRRGSS